MDNNNLLVSVICNTYNQENYVADAIIGILNQKTNFDYEVLIHDDASTDGTVGILKSFAEKHNSIRLFLEKENQYSKGVPISLISLPFAKGKYIAFCEGDDYWIDSNKLQRQIDYLESNPNCVLSTHAFQSVSDDGSRVISEYHPLNHDGVIGTETFIEWNFASIPQYGTTVWRKDLLESLPKEFQQIGGIGDYPRYIFSSLVGSVAYTNQVMSCWRIRNKGSWTESVETSAGKRIKHNESIIAFLSFLNSYTDGKYEECILKKQSMLRINNLYLQRKFKLIKKEPYYLETSAFFKLKVNLGIVFPKLMSSILNNKKRTSKKY